jgi:hypothetical protein
MMIERFRQFGRALAGVLVLQHVLFTTAPSRAGTLRETSITGRVVSGADSLPGLIVTAMSEAGGPTRETITGRDGTYRFDDLPEDVYRVDFDLVGGFDLVRRNHVRVQRGVTTRVDATVPLSTICECIEGWAGPAPDPRGANLRERVGQVVAESGQPLGHARLEVITPTTHEVAYADREGRFRVLISADQTWQLVASDSGFKSVTQSASGTAGSPLIFRLSGTDRTALPDTERFNRWCRCGRDLFRHSGR